MRKNVREDRKSSYGYQYFAPLDVFFFFFEVAVVVGTFFYVSLSFCASCTIPKTGCNESLTLNRLQ